MKIYTSYFAKMKHLPQDCVPISISLYTPFSIKISKLPDLAPTAEILNEWKSNPNKDKYLLDYNINVLGKTSINDILAKIEEIIKKNKGTDAVLVCFEKSGDFCHRHIVAQWFKRNGIDCEEYKFENKE